MQFINNGPDIPERLLQLHEDGRVVFFCGAGISYPAGLPGFSGLVNAIYDDLSVMRDAVQKAALNANQYDTAINLLETSIIGGRETVRHSLAKILTPKSTNQKDVATHEALLTLAKSHDGRIKLVTTNFDRLFEEAKVSKSLSFRDFKAPLLPVPKTRWNGLVYLHGLLPAAPTVDDLDQLILSSGDFGRAYLIERWAARFVSELFRNFSVCFVGYSINDPVLRYMTDAMAADQLLGEKRLEMFAFGSYSNGKKADYKNEWMAKSVTPILYCEDNYHAYLHETLRAWADAYRDGVSGKERMVVDCVALHPSTSTKHNNFAGRMLWALSHSDGLPAKRFAEFDPAPPLDWLEHLSQQRYGHSDLNRFGVSPNTVADKKLIYSLINRPTPYTHASKMSVVNYGYCDNQLDEVMFQLARWLIRHLDDPKLLIWVIKKGGQLHDRFIQLIQQRLNKLDTFASENKTSELDHIRKNAPNAIPRSEMRTLWNLVINGYVKQKTYGFGLNLYTWADQFKSEGLTFSTRLALRKILTPLISLDEIHSRNFNDNDVERAPKFEVVLASDHVHDALADLTNNERWVTALPELLDDFSTLLRDAFDLMRDLGDANDKEDCSRWHQPSISDHPQNKYHNYKDWTALIKLTREAWLETVKHSPSKARICVEAWMHAPYPIFKRLVFFAATQGQVISVQQAFDCLLTDEQWWLWAPDTKRETIRLLVFLAPQLDAAMMTKLESAILTGPPRNLNLADIGDDNLRKAMDHRIWLLLAKIDQVSPVLSEAGKAKLNELSNKYSWLFSEDERDEFSCWMSSGEGPHLLGDFIAVPRTRRGVLDYLLAHPVLDKSQHDDWRRRCSESFQATAYALCKLAKQNNWPSNRWSDALQAWLEEKLCDRSWHFMASVVVKAPNDFIQSLSYSLGQWVQNAAKVFDGDDENFFTLTQRILKIDFKDDVNTSDPVGYAINHPIGHVTFALFHRWFRKKPSDEQGLSESIKSIFIKLCDTKITTFRPGRVLLAAHAISLFRADKAWSEQYVLPLFNWNDSLDEARASWEGFLWSPQLYRPFIETIKSDFLDTVNHYAELGKHDHQFARVLTFAALDLREIFTKEELIQAFQKLPEDALHESVHSLALALEGAGENRENYWKNRVLPFLQDIWPKTKNIASNIYSESFSRLCIAAGNEFPSAMKAVKSWLQVIQDPNYVINCLRASELPARFPEESLQLLSIINKDVPYLSKELRQCLDDIRNQNSTLIKDNRFIALDALARKFNI